MYKIYQEFANYSFQTKTSNDSVAFLRFKCLKRWQGKTKGQRVATFPSRPGFKIGCIIFKVLWISGKYSDTRKL